MLTHGGSNLNSVCYIDSDVMSDKDFKKSTFGVVFTLGEQLSIGRVSSKSVLLTQLLKQSM